MLRTFGIQTISTNSNRLSLIILQKFPFHSVKKTIMHLNQNLFSSKICYSLLGSIHCVISRLTAKSLHLLILSLLGAKTICHQLVVTGLVTCVIISHGGSGQHSEVSLTPVLSPSQVRLHAVIDNY